MVPIVNPWGFANQERENVNNVDLNRNFDYYWENGSGKSPSGKNYKGSKVFSERESRNMKTLVESLDEITDIWTATTLYLKLVTIAYSTLDLLINLITK